MIIIRANGAMHVDALVNKAGNILVLDAFQYPGDVENAMDSLQSVRNRRI